MCERDEERQQERERSERESKRGRARERKRDLEEAQIITQSLFSSFLEGEETGFDICQLCATSVCSLSECPLYSIVWHRVYILSP